MIVGKVTEALDPIATVGIILGPDSVIEIDAVIDTGFNGALAVSQKLADRMRLNATDSTAATLADGRVVNVRCCEVTVEWAGTKRDIVAWILGEGCLVGMELLLGFRFRLDAVPNGEISIESM